MTPLYIPQNSSSSLLPKIKAKKTTHTSVADLPAVSALRHLLGPAPLACGSRSNSASSIRLVEGREAGKIRRAGGMEIQPVVWEA